MSKISIYFSDTSEKDMKIRGIEDRLSIIKNSLKKDIFNNEYINRTKKIGLFDYKGIDKPENLYYKALELFGIDKLIFGSDYPFSSLDNEVELLKRVKLTETEFDKITNKNITKILRRN